MIAFVVRHAWILAAAGSLALISAGFAPDLVVRDFAEDPRWDGYRNRLVPDPPRLTRQDFGWRDTRHAGGKQAGEIGGWIQRSLTPASFARAIPEKTLNDKLTASGRFAVTHDEGGSGAMFGWFHESSRGWRTPNSIGFRIDGNGGKYWVLFEYGTSHWLTGGEGTFEGRYQTTKTKPFASDGTSHEWSLTYDPAGHDGDGEVTFVLDGTSYKAPLAKGHKADGARFNRFGFWNVQVSGDGMDLYVDDLTIDGQPQDFSRDPQWIGVGNQGQFPDRAIRPLHDFGYSRTNHAGGKTGEIGGIVWRDEKPAWYGAPMGRVTLDDELTASGKIAFLAAGSDSAVRIGWFGAESLRSQQRPEHEEPVKDFLGLLIEGPSRIGHYFRPTFATSDGKGASADDGPIIRPDGRPHDWKLHYQPRGEGGLIRLTLDESERTLDVAPAQRKRGATFDRFGLFNVMAGGHHVEIYVDDLKFTERPSQANQ
jgi:hypothetical protein